MGNDTAAVAGPFRATVEDFESIVACGNECFPAEREAGGVVARWPHTYRCEPEHLGRFLVMKAGGRVVSNVTYVEQTLAVEGGALRVAGLAEVMTLPAYRGRGLMSRLLEYAIECIARDGYAMSDLGGDRLRYGRYGWECARRVWRFTLTPRSLAAAPVTTRCDVRAYSGAAGEIDAIRAIHDAEPLRVVRSREQYVRLLGRLGKEVHLALDGPRIAAYLVADPKANPVEVVEFGGSAAGVGAILRRVMEQAAGKPVRVLSPWRHPLNAFFTEASDDWHAGPSHMVRLFDLAATLRGFTRQLCARWAALGLDGTTRVTLGLAETGECAELLLANGEGIISAVKGRAADVMLPRRAMVRFLFGPAAPSATAPLPPSARLLDALLPLDFHIWPNEAV